MTEFAFLFRGRNRAAGSAEQQQRTVQRWGAWMGELRERGLIADPGQPLESRGKVVQGQGKAVNDGPFAEIKDVVNGFMIIKADSLETAVEISKGCPVLDDGGSVEIRPV